MAAEPTGSTTLLKIRTQHCTFCNHLLLSTTRTLSTLPRRTGETKDNAIILPLETSLASSQRSSNSDAAGAGAGAGAGAAQIQAQHTTLLLSTTIPDKRATLIRREDGIEKRLLLRCGRCRVVVGYYLDKVHWGKTKTSTSKSTSAGAGGENGDVDAEDEAEGEGEGEVEERPPAVYILPGAVVETEDMGKGGVGEREWRAWGDVQ